jgi:hypothetical protein
MLHATKEQYHALRLVNECSSLLTEIFSVTNVHPVNDERIKDSLKRWSENKLASNIFKKRLEKYLNELRGA